MNENNTIPLAAVTNIMEQRMLLIFKCIQTSEDVCCNIRIVKFEIHLKIKNMRCSTMFVTAVCVVFLFAFVTANPSNYNATNI